MTSLLTLLLQASLLIGQFAYLYGIPPPTIVVNTQTQECGWFWPGSGCHTCVLSSPDWSIYGPLSSESNDGCPDGFAFIDEEDVPIDCSYAQDDQYCCTDFGPGDVHGQCPNLLIHDEEMLCTFVDDIALCEPMPEGWHDGSEELCGDAYEWVDNAVSCSGSAASCTDLMTCEECLMDLCAWNGTCHKQDLIEGDFASLPPDTSVEAIDECMEYLAEFVCPDITTCEECLVNHCEWSHECGLGWVGGFFAALPRDTSAADEEAAAEQACNEHQAYLANEQICHERNSCEECIDTAFVEGDGFCLWFEDHGGWCASRVYHESQVSIQVCGEEGTSTGYQETVLATMYISFFLSVLYASL